MTILKCEGACGADSACESACEQGAASSSLAAFKAVVACDQGSCLSSCYGGQPRTGSGSGSGSSGGGGRAASGGGTCHSLTGCVQVNVTTQTSSCTAGVTYTMMDNCGQAFTLNGSDTGQSFGGSQYVNVHYACGETSDPVTCVEDF